MKYLSIVFSLLLFTPLYVQADLKEVRWSLAGSTSVYVNQTVEIRLEIDVDAGERFQVKQLSYIPDGTPNLSLEKHDAIDRYVLTWKSVFKQSGTVSFPESRLVGDLTRTFKSGFFTQSQTNQRETTVKPFRFEVKALPTPPKDFQGAIGDFSLFTKLSKKTFAPGEVLKLTLLIQARAGVIPETLLPTFMPDTNLFKVYPQEVKQRTQHTLTTEMLIIPLERASTRLPDATLACFDVKTGTYRTIKARLPVLSYVTPVLETQTQDVTIIGNEVQEAMGLYFAPTTRSLIIATIPANTPLIRKEVHGQWIRIEAKDHSGWIKAQTIQQ